MSLKEIISQSEPIAWTATGIGVAAFVSGWAGTRYLIDRSVCGRINTQCNTDLTLNECRQFTDNYVWNDVSSEARNVVSGTSSFNPLNRIGNRFKILWWDYVVPAWNVNKGLGPLVLTHEFGVTVGSTAIEVDLIFLSEDMWGEIFAGIAAPILIIGGYILTGVRRYNWYRYLNRQFHYLNHPISDMCKDLNKYEFQPQFQEVPDTVEEPYSEMGIFDESLYDERVPKTTPVGILSYLANKGFTDEFYETVAIISAGVAITLKIVEEVRFTFVVPSKLFIFPDFLEEHIYNDPDEIKML